MRKLFLLLFIGFLPLVLHAQTAKAIWCAGNTTLYFTYDTNTYAAGGTYNGQAITNVYTLPFSSTYAPWNSISSSITNVTVASNFSSFKPTSLAYWFYGLTNLTTATGLNYINTSNVWSMGYMFYNCSSLTSVDGLINWDTSSVTYMANMFYKCSSLTSLDGLSNWNTSNVTNMSEMFSSCSSLTSLEPLRNWNTGSVTNMGSMFSSCRSLTSLEPLSNWNTGNNTSMFSMFWGCSSLTSLVGLSTWNTGKVTDMASAFTQCSSLTSLDGLGNWDTSNVTSMGYLFYDCTRLTSVEVLSNWNTGKVTDMSWMFETCQSLTSLVPLSNWDTSQVTNMSGMFSKCFFTSFDDISNWDTSNVTNMSEMFKKCNRLASLDGISNWDTSNVTNMSEMFSGCFGLALVDWSSWDTGKVTNMYRMFYDCNKLKGITFGENFNMNKVTSSDNMFQNCSKLRYIDFYNSDYETSGSGMQFPLNTVNRSSGTFKGVPATTVIYMPHGNSYGTEVTNVRNVVYPNNGNDNDLRCHDYYSADKVDIEFPLDFKTNEAVYTRAMSNSYGSVVLPYAFTTNDNIQAYTLDAEHTETMYFKDIATVPAHTPFAFKKLASGSTADFTIADSNNNFGITVRATHSTNATEDTWTGSKGAPYEDVSNINMGAGSNVTGWSTKGYYITESVPDFDGAFYIASDRFYKANGALWMNPHRVTFHGAWTLGGSNNAKSYAIGTGSNLLETAIEAADLRKTEREADAIYDMQGRKVEKLQHGMNIVRMSDGTVRKVIKSL